MPIFLRNILLSALVPFALITVFYHHYRDALVVAGVIILLATSPLRRVVAHVVLMAIHGARNLAGHFGGLARGRTVRGGVWFREATLRGGHAWWENILSHPRAWITVTSFVVSLFLFWNKSPHAGMVSLLFSSLSLITCFESAWGSLGRWVVEYPAWVWTTISLVAVLVTGGHAYFLGGTWWWALFHLFTLSLLCAVITVAGGGPWLYQHTIGFAIDCLSGARGVGILLVSWGFIAGVGATTLHLTRGDEGVVRLLYSIFILCQFFGWGIIFLWQIWMKKKGAK